MSQTITVKSQTPEHLIVSLSWGRLVDTPPADELVRLTAGETFTIPAGHATAIRTKAGWQQGYAFTETVVTGPVDISRPIAMPPHVFEPKDSPVFGATLFLVLIAGTALNFALFAADFGYGILGKLAMVCVVFAGQSFAASMALDGLRWIYDRRGVHSCPDECEKTFWRDELEWIQAQPIRVAQAA